ncbi:MAG: hypothetical protein C4521_12440 [Actinobacteria bacterium]|nr:MAG: hypothetical protein C4521_12440 [Actinomycetota bacterium]
MGVLAHGCRKLLQLHPGHGWGVFG